MATASGIMAPVNLKSRAHGDGGLVYSTDQGRMCPECRQPLAHCVCAALAQEAPRGDGNVRVSRESKGRGGKTVTLVRGLPLDDEALQALAKRLKTACGTGGTVKDGVIELQGDHCARALPWLLTHGHPAKRSGG